MENSNTLLNYEIGTVKLRHHGFLQSFDAVKLEKDITADKSGYLTVVPNESDFAYEGKTIQAYSEKHAFHILQNERDFVAIRESNASLRKRLSNLEKAILNVYGEELTGVQSRTKLNNLFKKSEIIEERKQRKITKETDLREKMLQEKQDAQKALDIKALSDLLKKGQLITVSNNPTERINDCGTPFTGDTYMGCGNYWVAVTSGLIVASCRMDNNPINDFQTYREFCKNKLAEYGKVISGKGSGTQFFCKESEDLMYFQDHKIYEVPAPNGDGNLGYEHTNFQAL